MCVESCPAIGTIVCRKEFSGLSPDDLASTPIGGCINLRVSNIVEYRCGDNQTLGEILTDSGDCFTAVYSTSEVLYRCTPDGVNVALTDVESEQIEEELFFGGLIVTGLTEITAARYSIAAAVVCSLLLSILFSFGLQLHAFSTFAFAIIGNLLVMIGATYRAYVYYKEDNDLTQIASTTNTMVMTFGFVCIASIVAYLVLMVVVLRKAATNTVTEVAEASAKCVMSSATPICTSCCCCFGILVIIMLSAYSMLLTGSHGDDVELTYVASNNTTTMPTFPDGSTPTYTAGSYNITTTEFSYRSQLWQLYNFFAGLWLINLLWASSCLALSVQVSSWYYSEHVLSAGDKKITHKGGTAILHHFGSIVLGSACSTLFGWMNDVMSSIRGFKVLPIDSVNFVIIAVDGVGYFQAGMMAKRLSYAHKALLGPIIFATETCYSLVKFFIPSVSTLCSWILLQETNFPANPDTEIQYAVFPLLGMWIGSFFIASLIIGAISTVSKSLILLYFRDMDSDVPHHFAPQALADIIARQLEAEKLRVALQDSERGRRYSAASDADGLYKNEAIPNEAGIEMATSTGSHLSATRVAWDVSTGERTATDVDLEIIETAE
eukprot:TRINITY_DN1284_c3_g1_i1.p1 TRINITY_DN1284_c3_g1~~TRINITY_DN1284_c3_g1_i1.p1  ORF type:complete len:706 (+),score=92.21 TRINITY_DN1284_c3_g1_i1:299-2119(+)